MTTPYLPTRLPTIRQIQCFLAVCHELNFRKAAEQLNITQPPLTRQIQALEDLIGQPLFLRNTHEVLLTTAGQELLEKVEPLLDDLAETTELVSRPKKIKIGYTRFVNFENIPAIFNQLTKFDALIDSIHENFTSQQLLQNLLKGKLDIVLIGEKVFIDDAVRFVKVYTEPLMLVIPSNHIASKNQSVALSEVADLPLYWFSRNENPAYYDKCEAYFQHLAVLLKKVAEPKDSIMMFDKIAKGRGIALMPRSVCNFQQPGCCWKTLTNEDNEHLNIDIYMAVRCNEKNAAVLDIIESLTSL